MVLQATDLITKMQGLTNQETLSLLGTDVYLISFLLIFIIPLMIFLIPTFIVIQKGKVSTFNLFTILTISELFRIGLIILTLFGILPSYLNTL